MQSGVRECLWKWVLERREQDRSVLCLASGESVGSFAVGGYD